MNEILKMNLKEMAGLAFDCSCGRRHSVNIGKIVIGKNVLSEVVETAATFKEGKMFMMSDTNTYRVYGRWVEESLAGNGFSFKSFVFDTPHPLIPDERAVGRLLIEVEKGTSLIIAVGSGVLNDLGKFLSYKTGIPYIIVGTAPSMDGYASVVAPFIVGGVKRTLPGVYPAAIIADLDILRETPMEMLQAGFGDILGKLTALADWRLSRILNDELYCETCAKIVKDALDKCLNNIDGIVAREEKAVRYIMEGLILSGIAIGLHGNSRPASGAEHNFAHYWDMDAISRNHEHPLHGNSVAVGTVITSYVYELMRPELPSGLEAPKPGEVTGYLNKIGSCDNPRDLGISRALFRRSMLEALKLKPRYTIMHLAEERGMLESITDELTGRFYD